MGAKNTIDYVTVASTGNATDFGDLTSTAKCPRVGASSTRALAGSVGGGSFNINVDYVTIASTGNASDFGDLSIASNEGGLGASNSVICLMFGGNASGVSNPQIDQFTIATLGNATDFGDLRLVLTGSEFLNASGGAAASNCHGGLS
jgi:hypothetical protein